mgnify:CR=1 FL=1
MMHILVNSECTPGGLDRFRRLVHHLYMVEKVTPNFKPEKPGHYIRAWRKYRGLTLEQTAERVGTTHATLSRVERGLIPYGQPLLEAIAIVLNCTPADLLIRDPESSESLWTIWDQLAPVQRQQIVEIAQTFRKAG